MITPDMPIRIGKQIIKNRITMAPTVKFTAGEDGKVTDFFVKHYGLRAQHGCGLICVEATAVSPEAIIDLYYPCRTVSGTLYSGLPEGAGSLLTCVKPSSDALRTASASAPRCSLHTLYIHDQRHTRTSPTGGQNSNSARPSWHTALPGGTGG